MKEFNKKVEELLKESTARIQGVQPMEMISGPTKKVDRDYKFHNRGVVSGNIPSQRSRQGSMAGFRCEYCDWCKTTAGSTFLDTTAWTETGQSGGSDIGNDGRINVFLDRGTNKYLCNVCWYHVQRTSDANRWHFNEPVREATALDAMNREGNITLDEWLTLSEPEEKVLSSDEIVEDLVTLNEDWQDRS